MIKQENPPFEELTYEQALNQLEEIITTFEDNEQSLDEALSLFERGQALVHRCTELLDLAELRVTQIINGDLVEFPIEE